MRQKNNIGTLPSNGVNYSSKTPIASSTLLTASTRSLIHPLCTSTSSSLPCTPKLHIGQYITSSNPATDVAVRKRRILFNAS